MVACLNHAIFAVSAYTIGTNISIMLLSHLPTIVVPDTITGKCTVTVTVTVTVAVTVTVTVTPLLLSVKMHLYCTGPQSLTPSWSL